MWKVTGKRKPSKSKFGSLHNLVGPSKAMVLIDCKIDCHFLQFPFSHSYFSNGIATLWIVDHQAPLSMGFSRQEYWSGLPCPPQGDLPDPGIKHIVSYICRWVKCGRWVKWQPTPSVQLVWSHWTVYNVFNSLWVALKSAHLLSLVSSSSDFLPEMWTWWKLIWGDFSKSKTESKQTERVLFPKIMRPLSLHCLCWDCCMQMIYTSLFKLPLFLPVTLGRSLP